MFELVVADSNGQLEVSIVQDYASADNAGSSVLGDVQRLPNGNTLVTFSSKGLIQELDPTGKVIRTLTTTAFGYADWRQTLYGPPSRR